MSSRFLFRALLACLLLWGQVAYSAHEIDSFDKSHVHSTDCALCFSGHFHMAAVPHNQLLQPEGMADVAADRYQSLPRPRTASLSRIRAPPLH